MARAWLIVLALACVAAAQYATEIRAPGVCAMYGNCGTAVGAAEGDLPCPNNTQAIISEQSPVYLQFRAELQEFCGDVFSLENRPAICCDQAQFTTMKTSLEMARPFVMNCPACDINMRTLYCEMTCSPDQSLFYNVSNFGPDPSGNTDNISVLGGKFWVDESYGTKFYDSCKDVKYGMSNALAMLFIGGGAENYLEMLRYMGEPKALGTPFEIFFPNNSIPEEFGDDTRIIPLSAAAYGCMDEDYACVCVDCPASCPIAPPIESDTIQCNVGSLNCVSFTLIILYSVLLLISLGLMMYRPKSSGVAKSASDDVLPQEWKLYTGMQKFYFKLGRWVAHHPSLVLLISILCIEVCLLGLMNFQVETDPVELWVAHDSATREQKAFFDENFGPFYRTEQIIVSRPDSPDSIMQEDIVARIFDFESGAAQLVATYDGHNVTMFDLCFKPLGEDGACVITSVTGYWQADKALFEADDDWYGHMKTCLENPSFPGDDEQVSCLPPHMDPIKPELSLGGFEGTDYMDAQALVVTFVFLNSLDEEYISAATEWEKLFVEYMNGVASANPDLRITYYTESGVELELARESSADIVTVAISYLVMFIYVSIALGKFTSWKRVVVDTKFTLGIAGVLLCVASVLAAIGIFSAFGIKTSLIIAEVIPFLVLAVGVDNIFIMVNTFESLDKSVPVRERCAATMSEIGPTITLSALSETVAFALGTIVSMPAVNSFAAYSAVAVFIDFLLQITCFLALVAVDAKRKESKRVDCIPCIKTNVPDQSFDELADQGLLQRFVERFYSPFLVHRVTRFIAVFGTLAMLVAFASFIPKVELGLDQTIALPQDSYLIPYFADQASLLEVGAPVYFVVRGGNSSTDAGKQELCYSYRECLGDSVSNVIAEEARRADESYVALNAASWIDDFLVWINPINSRCCRIHVDGSFCQENDNRVGCRTCYTPSEFDQLEFGPVGQDFITYLDYYLQAIPGTSCAFAGAAAYGDAIVPDHEAVTVSASHFRTYHTVLVTQADFINAYKNSIRISERIMEEQPHLDVFAYSLFYVYFEQYITIVSTTFLVLSVALLAVFAVTWVVLGSFLSAVFVCLPVLMIVVDLAGMMALWDITLNAVSLVNMVMALGISVEFCSHIVRAYATATGTREERATTALNEIGASVFSGITITKFLGVVVLAFAQSQIFVVYYFRMYISIVFFGFIHGLFFLPALLCYVGPPSVAKSSALRGYLVLDADKEAKQIQQRQSIYGTVA